jgi:hypothetical protein
MKDFDDAALPFSEPDSSPAAPDSVPVSSPVEPGLSREFNRERKQDMPKRNKAPPHLGLTKIMQELAHRHSTWQVFADFCEMTALAFSNAVDRAHRDKREARYMQIVPRYKPEELKRFPEMLGILTDEMATEVSDILGRTYHELELHNKWAGQYFTPYPVCQMMAKMTLHPEEDVRAIIERRGFVTASEPAAGSGAMVIALAQELRAMDINYQQHLHVTAVDVDAKCVHMAYAQFTLLHIPAVIVHGNSLSLEEWDHWYTPAHIMGGWKWKLKRAAEDEPGLEERQAVHGVPPRESPPAEAPEDKPPSGPQLTLF